jgi:2-furoyl-CoA dehydrogenase FAD binding subunit
MKPAPFGYAAPTRLEEAVRLLAEDADAMVLAGGQSLLPLLNFRMARPSLLVDIKRIEEGRTITAQPGCLRIGFGVTQARALDAPEIREWAPLLAEALPFVGYRETRNRGTVVGSIAHSDPAAELPGVMVALGANYELCSAEGIRTIAATDFHLGPYTTARERGEVITAVEIPATKPGSLWGFREVSHGPFALCGLAAICEPSKAGLKQLRLVAVGVAGRPLRLSQIEQSVQAEPDTARAASLAWTRRAQRDGLGSAQATVLATLAQRQVEKFLREGGQVGCHGRG